MVIRTRSLRGKMAIAFCNRVRSRSRHSRQTIWTVPYNRGSAFFALFFAVFGGACPFFFFCLDSKFSVSILGLSKRSGFSGLYMERLNARLYGVSRKHNIFDKHCTALLEKCQALEQLIYNNKHSCLLIKERNTSRYDAHSRDMAAGAKKKNICHWTISLMEWLISTLAQASAKFISDFLLVICFSTWLIASLSSQLVVVKSFDMVQELKERCWDSLVPLKLLRQIIPKIFHCLFVFFILPKKNISTGLQ